MPSRGGPGEQVTGSGIDRKAASGPVEELLTLSTALADGIPDTLNQGTRSEWLG